MFSFGAPTLSIGDNNAAVVTLQSDLAQLGYLSASEVDGIFGIKTAYALATYQADRNLTVSIEADAQTWAQLQTDLGPLAVADDRDAVNPALPTPLAITDAASGSQLNVPDSGNTLTVSAPRAFTLAGVPINWKILAGLGAVGVGLAFILLSLLRKKPTT